MSGAMEDVLSLPVGGIQLGSSAPNSPMNANALPQPSSDGFAPSSPIEHTQKSIRERQNHSSNAFNYNDNGNQSQTFSLDIPPPWQNSTASHRLLNPPSKRPSNISPWNNLEPNLCTLESQQRFKVTWKGHSQILRS